MARCNGLSSTDKIDHRCHRKIRAATARDGGHPGYLDNPASADDDEITIEIDTAGTGAKGLKVYLYYVRG
jgi:hypothetical protein